jgi:hypothetical protein
MFELCAEKQKTKIQVPNWRHEEYTASNNQKCHSTAHNVHFEKLHQVQLAPRDMSL